MGRKQAKQNASYTGSPLNRPFSEPVKTRLIEFGRFIVKHKTQSQRLTRKLSALRQEAW